MTLMQAAIKWGLSANWIRELIKSGRVQATLRKDGPVPYYDIPDDLPRPGSMSRAPHRKGTGETITKEAMRRREKRAAEKATTAKTKKKPAAKKSTSKLLDVDGEGTIQ